MKLWLRILLVVLVLLLVGAGWFGFAAYRYWTVTVPNSLAGRAAADLVIFCMAENDGAWPKSWDDLKPIFDKRNTHFVYDPGGGSFERLKEGVEIDWNADPRELKKVIDSGSEPPFHVIWRRDGGTPLWESHEPNAQILAYLQDRPPMHEPVRKKKPPEKDSP